MTFFARIQGFEAYLVKLLPFPVDFVKKTLHFSNILLQSTQFLEKLRFSSISGQAISVSCGFYSPYPLPTGCTAVTTSPMSRLKN
jgi:hypothetical protein